MQNLFNIFLCASLLQLCVFAYCRVLCWPGCWSRPPCGWGTAPGPRSPWCSTPPGSGSTPGQGGREAGREGGARREDRPGECLESAAPGGCTWSSPPGAPSAPRYGPASGDSHPTLGQGSVKTCRRNIQGARSKVQRAGGKEHIVRSKEYLNLGGRWAVLWQGSTREHPLGQGGSVSHTPPEHGSVSLSAHFFSVFYLCLLSTSFVSVFFQRLFSVSFFIVFGQHFFSFFQYILLVPFVSVFCQCLLSASFVSVFCHCLLLASLDSVLSASFVSVYCLLLMSVSQIPKAHKHSHFQSFSECLFSFPLSLVLSLPSAHLVLCRKVAVTATWTVGCHFATFAWKLYHCTGELA